MSSVAAVATCSATTNAGQGDCSWLESAMGRSDGEGCMVDRAWPAKPARPVRFAGVSGGG
ncbi:MULTISPECIES: hypothetical protein [unclassified Frankia]|uniref:hypothetical protein n=1 Tax=unclassified Frankia TaxID=2632575 RepID=UPI002AD48F5E|nr:MULTISPECIES: hypothetical protein [unclassified Frankia]